MKGGRVMKKNAIVLTVAISVSCFMAINGAWAGTAGYSDSGQNGTTNHGVVGATYTGTTDDASAIAGHATALTGAISGGYFESDSVDGIGVYGKATATGFGSTYGGYFENKSDSGAAVLGFAQGQGMAGYFVSFDGHGVWADSYYSVGAHITYGGRFAALDNPQGVGVYGEGGAFGGDFETDSEDGAAVRGTATAASGLTSGGYFENWSDSGTGVYGYASANSGETIGVYGKSDSPNGKGVKGRGKVGIFGVTGRGSGKGVKGVARNSTGVNYGVYGKTNSPSGYGVYSDGNMKVDGDFVVTGAKSAVVKLDNGEGLRLYAVESSENWFEDFGSSKLEAGAMVKIDPTFAKTVNTNVDYHVFLTPRGNCQGLYVTSLGKTCFEVRELNEGKSNISFSYRIVAKRKGFENQRLARISKEKMTAIAESELDEDEDTTEVALNKKRFDKTARLRVAK
jgi:hypothetical protein